MKLSELSRLLEASGITNRMEGREDPDLTGVNTLSDAEQGELSFLTNSKYREQLRDTRASAAIVELEEAAPEALPVLRCPNPYGAVAAAIKLIHGTRIHPAWGHDPKAIVANSARIGEGANIGPHVYIDEDVVIGSHVTLYPGCYIGRGVVLGDHVTCYPNVVIYDGSRLGSRVTLHAGTVVGQDGLGYAKVNDRWEKIPQAGWAVIEDDVEMGANCCIDRATLGQTVIGAGTKFSDAVVIGHGTKVGRHGMFVAQTGLAGSVNVGENVTMGGQVGVAGHLSIGDNVVIGAKSGVWSDIPANERYFGSPAFKWKQFWKQVAAVQKLPELIRKIQRLEAEVAALRPSRSSDD
ncbi:MAG: UDP-3-O-(3-hydroxymyristoyl)glucosamine N-acyltransferase [Methylococcus sp.]